MAKLYIPQIGDKLKIIENWNCKVFNERRNSKVFSGLKIDTTGQIEANIDVTFPKGTILRVDRLYVRAPASSFDSITFTIESSPIKSLVKARFWVKLMDANTMQFEEIIVNMDSHEKIKSLYRYVALKNNYKNSEHLNIKDSSDVSKEIYEHFEKNGKNPISFKLDISVEEFWRTIQLEEKWRRYYKQDKEVSDYIEKNLTICREILKNNSKVTINLLPVLDGFVFNIMACDFAIEVNKQMDLFNKVESNYWGEKHLGSSLANTIYYTITDKKELPYLIVNRLESLFNMEISHKNEIKSFKNDKDFLKFLKSLRD